MASIRVRLVVADRVGGEPPRCLYCGQDAAKADAEFDRASQDASNEFVALFVYPTPARKSFPAENAAMTERGKRLAKEEAERLAREAADRAKKLEAEAKAAKEKADEAKAKAATHQEKKPTK